MNDTTISIVLLVALLAIGELMGWWEDHKEEEDQ